VRVDESSAAPPEQPSQPEPAQPPTPSDLALGRYRARIRRLRIWYYAGIAVVLAAVVAAVTVGWSHSEVAHTTLKTAAKPAPSVALQTPAQALRLSWQTGDATAIGTPYWGGTVITYSSDSVRGRNAATGEITWSYTRTDRTVCQAIQDEGVTVAIFELHGNCDQVTALDSTTGARKWSRTLDKDGMPLNGHPTYAVSQYTIMMTTPTVIYAIDPAGGLDRWTFTQQGCTIRSAVFGTQGALISQNCVNPDCGVQKFCGAGDQLLLRDATAGRSDADKDKANPDQIKWNLIGSALLPASADQLISAIDTSTHELRVLDAAKGTLRGRLALQRGAIGPTIAQVATARAELLWIDGVTYSVELTGADYLWATATTGPPTVTSLPGAPAGTTDLSQSELAAAVPGGVALLDPNTGKASASFPVAAPAGSRAYPFSSGFVVAGSTTAVYG
jgi:hypothetical protein